MFAFKAQGMAVFKIIMVHILVPFPQLTVKRALSGHFLRTYILLGGPPLKVSAQGVLQGTAEVKSAITKPMPHVRTGNW